MRNPGSHPPSKIKKKSSDIQLLCYEYCKSRIDEVHLVAEIEVIYRQKRNYSLMGYTIPYYGSISSGKGST